MSINDYEIPHIGLDKELICTENLNSTDKGFLPKWWFGDVLLKSGEVKLGDIKPKQCYTEVLAYLIGKSLGFSVIPYTLHNVHTRGFSYGKLYALCDVEPQHFVACGSQNFLKKNEELISLPQIYRDKLPSYSELIEDFPQIERDLNAMLLFDFLINNTDRHFNNFQLIRSPESDIRLCPIYDNGYSLLVDCDKDTLLRIVKEEGFVKRCDKAKPFNGKHSKQIKLLQRQDVKLPKINFIDWSQLKSIIWDFKFLSDLHKIAIEILLEDRYLKIKELYDNYGE